MPTARYGPGLQTKQSCVARLQRAAGCLLLPLLSGLLSGCPPPGWYPDPPEPPDAIWNPPGRQLAAGTELHSSVSGTAPQLDLRGWHSSSGGQLGNSASASSGPLNPTTVAIATADGEPLGRPARGSDGLWRLRSSSKLILFDDNGRRTGEVVRGGLGQAGSQSDDLLASPDGTQFYYARGRDIVCFGRDHVERWATHAPGAESIRSLRVSASGQIVACCRGGADLSHVWAAEPDGSVAWSWSSPEEVQRVAQGPLGQTCTLDNSGRRLRYVVDGSQVWTLELARRTYNPPSFGLDGSVYVITGNEAQYPKDAISYIERIRPSGQQLEPIQPSFHPFLDEGYPGLADGSLFVHTGSVGASSLVCFGPDGKQRWSNGDVSLCKRIYPLSDGGAVLTGQIRNSDTLARIGGDGRTVWSANPLSAWQGDPLSIDGSGAVLLASGVEVTRFSAAGQQQFSLRLSSGSYSRLRCDNAGNSYAINGGELLSFDRELAVRWRSPIADPHNHLVQELLLRADGTSVIVYRESLRVYSPAGALLRSIQLPELQPSSVYYPEPQAVFGADGLLLVSGINDRQLLAWDAISGQRRWTYTDETGVDKHWVIDAAGRSWGVSNEYEVIEGSMGGIGQVFYKRPRTQSLLCLDRNGQRLSKTALSGLLLEGAAQPLQLSPDGDLWLSLSDGSLLRLDPDNLASQQSLKPGAFGATLLSAAPDGRVLVSLAPAGPYAGWPLHVSHLPRGPLALLDSAGNPLWQREIASFEQLSFCCDATGMVYISGGGSNLRAIAPDGSEPFATGAHSGAIALDSVGGLLVYGLDLARFSD